MGMLVCVHAAQGICGMIVCVAWVCVKQGIPELASACEVFSNNSAEVMEQLSQNKQLASECCLRRVW